MLSTNPTAFFIFIAGTPHDDAKIIELHAKSRRGLRDD